MLIESLSLEGIGPFRDRLDVGPLGAGLNILAQPNEWGKSTVVKALGRALFDRYRSEAEEIKQLRPAGSSLSPRIELVFVASGDRYRLVKGFLDRKGCELYRWSEGAWDRTDDSDRADQRLRGLLGAPVLDGRIAKPETWGFLRYLWARQDAPPAWPDWTGACGDTTRSRLAAVSIDPIARTLAEALRERSDLLFTSTGKVKTGSALAKATEESASIEKELAEIAHKRAALEDLQQTFARLEAELPVLQRELETKRADAGKLREDADAAEKLQTTIRHYELEFARAQETLLQLKKDEASLHGVGESQKLAVGDRQRIERSREATFTSIPQLETAVAEAQKSANEARERRIAAEARLHRHRALIQLLQLREEHARLARQSDRAAAAQQQLRQLEEARGRVPAISTGRLKKLRELDRDLRDVRVRLEMIGLRVSVAPHAGVTLSYSADGEARKAEVVAGEREVIHAAQLISLDLIGWGRIDIASGATEVTALTANLSKHESELQTGLAELGIASFADAEAAFDQGRTLDQQIKAAVEQLRAHLGEWSSLGDLEVALSRAEAAIGQQVALLCPDETESSVGLASLRSDEQALIVELAQLAASEQGAHQIIDDVRRKLEEAMRQREEYTSQLAALEARERGLADQSVMIEARYPQGIAAALTDAQCEWVKAEARLVEARRQMPPNAEKLAERSGRAVRALAETQAHVERVRTELQRVEVQLSERGGDGLYSRQAELEERLEWVRAEAERHRKDGIAARLLCGLIQRRQAKATRQVLGPLENRITDVFASLTGNRTRRVWFDETLQIRGIGPNENELVRFEDLSRGAREQLLLALRAAIALELSADEPQCVILDDVLVNTDAVRQENVLDYLQELAQRVQVLVLTCHAERYRGVGQLLAPRYGAVEPTA
jgi:exonuclease SbcC